MPLAFASAVPVKTDQGEASPQPTMPALVAILTMAPGIDSSMSPTPCRRFILSGQRTTSTPTPVMRSSLMTVPRQRAIGADCALLARLYLVRTDPYNLRVRWAAAAQEGRRGYGNRRREENGRRDRRRDGRRDRRQLPAAQGTRRRAHRVRKPGRRHLLRQRRLLQRLLGGADLDAGDHPQRAQMARRSAGP